MLFGVFLLILSCICMTALILVEGQWEDKLINYQHFINEAVFYLLLLCLLVCLCILDGDLKEIKWRIGAFMITLVYFLISFNIGVIIYDSIRHLRLICKRYW